MAAVEKIHGLHKIALVAPRPGGIGLAGRPPLKRLGQLGPGPQVSALLGMALGDVSHPQVLAGSVGLVAQPVRQLLPVADQAFVGDVEVGVGVHRLAGRWHQKGVVGVAERGGHVQHLVGCGVGHIGHIGQPGQAPHPPAVAANARQGLEQALGDPPAPRGGGAIHAQGQAGQHLVGMALQGLAHATGGLVVVQRDLAARRGAGLPLPPGAHQRVLKDRQLVGAFAHIVEQAVDQRGRQHHALHRRRAGDGLANLVAGEPGDQVLPAVDGLGQVAKARAVAQKIRAHRQHHIDAHGRLVDGFEQQLDEGAGIVGSLHLVQRLDGAKQLFELIDQHQQAVAFGQQSLAHRLHQAQAAAAQRDSGKAGLSLGQRGVAQHAGCIQRAGQIADGIGARAQVGHPPATVVPGHEAAVQAGQQAGAHQGRFAAARGADDGQKARQPQPAQQLGALRIAAKKQMGLIGLKWPQARVGVGQRGGLGRWG